MRLFFDHTQVHFNSVKLITNSIRIKKKKSYPIPTPSPSRRLAVPSCSSVVAVATANRQFPIKFAFQRLEGTQSATATINKTILRRRRHLFLDPSIRFVRPPEKTNDVGPLNISIMFLLCSFIYFIYFVYQ